MNYLRFSLNSISWKFGFELKGWFLWFCAGCCCLSLSAVLNAEVPEHVGRGAYPDITFDSEGTIHLVYVRDETLRYRYREAGSVEWSAEENTGMPQGLVSRSDPEVLVDPLGRVVAMVGGSVSRRVNGEWTALNADFYRDTDMAMNSKGDIYIVRRGGHFGGFLGLIKCLVDSDTFSFLPDPDISGGFERGSNDHVYGSIAVSPIDDSLHIVYRHGSPRKVAYRLSTEDGWSWQAAGITQREWEAPDITVSAGGKPYIANGDGILYGREEAPGPWKNLGLAFPMTHRDLPKLIVDKSGAVHVVAFGGKYNRYEYGTWDGHSVLPKLSQDSLGLGYPDLAEAPDGSVWIVYEEGDELVRDDDSDLSSGESDLLLLRRSGANITEELVIEELKSEETLVRLRFPVGEETYRLETSTDLEVWESQPEWVAIASVNEDLEWRVNVNSTNGPRFWRAIRE